MIKAMLEHSGPRLVFYLALLFAGVAGAWCWMLLIEKITKWLERKRGGK